jgi:hypothetical protein
MVSRRIHLTSEVSGTRGVFIVFNIEFSLLFLRSYGFEQAFLKRKEYPDALLQRKVMCRGDEHKTRDNVLNW